MIKYTHIVLLAAGLAVSGCASKLDLSAPVGAASEKVEAQAAFTRFPDIPMPSKVEMDLKRTLIVGGGDRWFGRLVINTSHDANDMFDFFKQELTAFGWREIASLRSEISVLTYSRQDRIAIIQIQGGRISGSEYTITVSPRGTPQPPPGASSGGGAPGPAQRLD